MCWWGGVGWGFVFFLGLEVVRFLPEMKLGEAQSWWVLAFFFVFG